MACWQAAFHEGDLTTGVVTINSSVLGLALVVWLVSFSLMRLWRNQQDLISNTLDIEGDLV